jgi:hypothetical protein
MIVNYICNTFIVHATVIAIVNYISNAFIVQVTGRNTNFFTSFNDYLGCSLAVTTLSQKTFPQTTKIRDDQASLLFPV